MAEIRFIKDCSGWCKEGVKVGYECNTSKTGADNAVKEGFAEYVEETKDVIKAKAKEKFVKKRFEKEAEFEFNKSLGIISDVKYLASQFIAKQPIFYDENRIWWLWDFKECKWSKIDDVDLLNAFDKLFRANTTDQKFKTELVDAIKRLARMSAPKVPERSWIQFKDVIVDVMTGKEFKATPEYFMTNPIPWKLGESEETPTFDKLFKEWVVTEGRQDESYVTTLYEIISYIPLMDYPIHLIFAFTGEGMNGKGSFLRTCEKFVGDSNTLSSDWDLLTSSNFETSEFYKKLLCCMGDIDKGIFSKTKWIKRLTGQDTIPMQFKHKPRFNAKNYAKILVATNDIPETTDKSKGFYRRWCIVDFFNEFPDRGRDIVDIIPNVEFENLARKSIRILKEVLTIGKFTNEGTIEDRKKKYEEHVSSIEDFIVEYCEKDMIGEVIFSDFWYQYNGWLKGNGLNIQSKPQVSKELTTKGYIIKNKRIMKTNSEGVEFPSTIKMVFGLKWKYEEETEPEIL